MSLRPPVGLGLPGAVVELLRGYYDELINLGQLIAGQAARYINVTFAAATTDVLVFHGLRAPVSSWEVVDTDADANVWRSATVNDRPTLYLILQASAPVTVKVRVA